MAIQERDETTGVARDQIERIDYISANGTTKTAVSAMGASRPVAEPTSARMSS